MSVDLMIVVVVGAVVIYIYYIYIRVSMCVCLLHFSTFFSSHLICCPTLTYFVIPFPFVRCVLKFWSVSVDPNFDWIFTFYVVNTHVHISQDLLLSRSSFLSIFQNEITKNRNTQSKNFKVIWPFELSFLRKKAQCSSSLLSKIICSSPEKTTLFLNYPYDWILC